MVLYLEVVELYSLTGLTGNFNFSNSTSIGVLGRLPINYKTSIHQEYFETSLQYEQEFQIRQDNFYTNLAENIVLSQVRQISEES